MGKTLRIFTVILIEYRTVNGTKILSYSKIFKDVQCINIFNINLSLKDNKLIYLFICFDITILYIFLFNSNLFARVNFKYMIEIRHYFTRY